MLNYLYENWIAIAALSLSIINFARDIYIKKEENTTKLFITLNRVEETEVNISYNTMMVNGSEIPNPLTYKKTGEIRKLFFIVKITNQSKYRVYIENIELIVGEKCMVKYYDKIEDSERESFNPLETKNIKWEMQEYYINEMDKLDKNTQIKTLITTTDNKKFYSNNVRNSGPTIKVDSIK